MTTTEKLAAAYRDACETIEKLDAKSSPVVKAQPDSDLWALAKSLIREQVASGDRPRQ